jgi:hypothetical protein
MSEYWPSGQLTSLLLQRNNVTRKNVLLLQRNELGVKRNKVVWIGLLVNRSCDSLSSGTGAGNLHRCDLQSS